MRYGNWKLVKYRSAKVDKPKRQAGSNPGWRLYDLSKDIGEKNDRAKQHPEVVQKILNLLKRDGLL